MIKESYNLHLYDNGDVRIMSDRIDYCTLYKLQYGLQANIENIDADTSDKIKSICDKIGNGIIELSSILDKNGNVNSKINDAKFIGDKKLIDKYKNKLINTRVKLRKAEKEHKDLQEKYDKIIEKVKIWKNSLEKIEEGNRIQGNIIASLQAENKELKSQIEQNNKKITRFRFKL